MKNYKGSSKQKGFTIVELMISTVVFSLVLLVASAAIVEVGKKYYRGITYARTQEVANTVVDEISQSLQFTSQSIKVPIYPDLDGINGPDIKYGPIVAVDPLVPDTFYFCVGAKRYTFAVDRKLVEVASLDKKEKNHVFWVDEPIAGCAEAVGVVPASLNQENPSDSSTFPANNGRELLDRNMRITKLSIIPRSNGLWSVNLSIAAGDDDQLSLLDEDGEQRIVCEGTVLSAEFCATSEISSNISKRIQ